MSGRYPRWRYHFKDGCLPLRECVVICFFMRRSHVEIKKSILQSLETFRRAVGPQALNWYVDKEGDFQPLNDEAWELLGREMDNSKGYRFLLEEHCDQASGYCVEYSGRWMDETRASHAMGEVSRLHCYVPLEYLEEQGPARVRALALELAGELPFSYGYASLAFSYGEGLPRDGWKFLKPLCFRYPGVDVTDPSSMGLCLGPGVRNAYWLTFLGQPVLGELGGLAGLRARLANPTIHVEDVPPERALVTLGEWPETGDLEAGQTLPLHRELARVLEPWRVHSRFTFGTLSHDEVRRWERRFLEEEDSPLT